ncbi:hypothetical protein BJF78_26640 [Pseudonocardia sp. CNS-139]|nr:hypothetical protein BJF78_26640 [Pseudonocardia sp. CNS-139]
MWAFLSSRLRTWLIMAVIVPLLGWLLGRAGDLVEARRGPNGLSKGLHTAAGWLGGPRARRRRAADPAGPQDPGLPAR